jgi:hypothetical protein
MRKKIQKKLSQSTAGIGNTQGHPTHLHKVENPSFPQLLGLTKWFENEKKLSKKKLSQGTVGPGST